MQTVHTFPYLLWQFLPNISGNFLLEEVDIPIRILFGDFGTLDIKNVTWLNAYSIAIVPLVDKDIIFIIGNMAWELDREIRSFSWHVGTSAVYRSLKEQFDQN